MTDENTSFKLMRMYLRDVSYESPSVPEAFKIGVEPEIDLRVRVAARALGDDVYEVVLTGGITARAEGHTLFLCEAQQAGLFRARGYDGEKLERQLHVHCPKQLFPFLREVLAGLTMKGGFPPVMISPVRFDELYTANKQSKAQV